MWRFLRFLFTGSMHEHKWKKIDSINVFDSEEYFRYNNGNVLREPCGTKIILQCEVCGNLKSKEI